MTCAKTDSGQWTLTFSEAEADFIINTMARMGAHYQEDVTKMPPSLRAYWRGSLSRSAQSRLRRPEGSAGNPRRIAR